MKGYSYLFSAIALLMFSAIGSFAVKAQTPSATATVLGCSNPAPAIVGQSTVFFSKCTTPAFVPPTSTSLIASVSKTTPQWLHSFGSYKTTDMLVACPAGAVVSGGACTSAGKDVSGVVQQALVASFSIAPPPASCPATFVTVNWACSVSADKKTAICTAPLTP